MTGRAPLAILCGLALAGAGAATVVVARAPVVRAAGDSATRPAPAPSGPGYVLMDLPAIERAVRGGKPVLVHFWASWCGPCLEELPLVDKFARESRARGLDVLSLSLDDPGRSGGQVVKVLTRSAPSLTRAIVKVADSDAFINAIDPRWEGAIPAVFGFDARGQLRGRIIGEASRRDLDDLASRVRP